MPAPTSLPVSSRGKATRQRLLDGARRVFEERGFLETRVAHIAKEAGVAYGSFYTHFASKEEVFYAVATELFAEMFAPDAVDEESVDTPRARFEHANATYWERYRKNALMMGIVEQVAGIDEGFARVRQQQRQATYDRTSASIRHWQELGLVPAALDPDISAQALGAMVDRTLYLRCVLGEGDPDQAALDMVNLLVMRALGLDEASTPKT